MAEPKTILVDMDSTLVDMLPMWLGAYNMLTGDNLRIEDLKTWNTHDHARHGRRVYEPLNIPGFFENLPPMDGAIEAMQEFHRQGHVIVIASAAISSAHYTEKVKWCRKFFPWVPLQNIALFGLKHLIRGHVFIDDSPHQADTYRLYNQSAFIAGIEHPYNANSKEYDLLAKDWKTPEAAWKEIKKQVVEFLSLHVSRGG